MAIKCDFRFDAHLLDHIKFGRNCEAKLMLNEKLAKKYDSLVTLLHRASSYDNVEIVERLIELGSNINFCGAGGQTPLMIAVENERFSTVKVLLDAGADVDVVNANGQSALQMIFHSDYYDAAIIEEFVHKVKNAFSKVKDIADKLVESGCDLHHAITLKKLNLINSMLSYYDMEVENRERSEALTEKEPVIVFLHLDLDGSYPLNFCYGNLYKRC